MIILKTYFLPSAVSEWKKLDFNIRNSSSLNTFKKKLLNFIRPGANSVLHIHNPLGNKLLTRLRLGLSHNLDINLGNAFNVIWILYANMTMTWNQQCISFSTAPTFSFLGKPSFRKLRTLVITFYLKEKRN